MSSEASRDELIQDLVLEEAAGIGVGQHERRDVGPERARKSASPEDAILEKERE